MNSGSNSSIDPEWESQLVEYSLGVMDAAAAADFERSLNECRAHVLMARQYADLSGALGLAVVPAEPPEGHRARFMAKLAATPQGEVAGLAAAPAPRLLPVPGATEGATSAAATLPTGAPAAGVADLEGYRERRRSTGAWQWVAAAAALVLLVISGYGWLSAERTREQAERLSLFERAVRSDLERQKEQLEAQLAASENSRRVLDEQVAELRVGLNIPPNWMAFRAQGTEADPEAWAIGFVNADTNQVVVMTQNLMPLTQAQQYELWWLPKDPNAPPVAAGKFPVNEQGQERVDVTAPQDLTAFSGVGITLEPIPDPDPVAPSGPLVMAGTYEFP